MDTIKLWARNGEAVRQAIALGELVHIEMANEELTDRLGHDGSTTPGPLDRPSLRRTSGD